MSVVDHPRLRRISTRAASVRLVPLLLSLLALPLVLVGRCAYVVVAVVRWVVAAVMTGYEDARGPRAG